MMMMILLLSWMASSQNTSKTLYFMMISMILDGSSGYNTVRMFDDDDQDEYDWSHMASWPLGKYIFSRYATDELWIPSTSEFKSNKAWKNEHFAKNTR